MSGNFFSCSKGVEDPLEIQEVRCDLPRVASAEMGLISPGRENLLDFLELRQVLSTNDGDLRDPLWWPQERPVPMLVTRGLSGFLYHRCRGLRPCLESVPECEDSSPVLTWILGYFWSLPRRVSPRLEWGHARVLSSRAEAAVSRFSSHGSKDLWLSLEDFPKGCPMCHRGVSGSSS